MVPVLRPVLCLLVCALSAHTHLIVLRLWYDTFLWWNRRTIGSRNYTGTLEDSPFLWCLLECLHVVNWLSVHQIQKKSLFKKTAHYLNKTQKLPIVKIRANFWTWTAQPENDNWTLSGYLMYTGKFELWVFKVQVIIKLCQEQQAGGWAAIVAGEIARLASLLGPYCLSVHEIALAASRKEGRRTSISMR